ncbi:hypothetical protein [Actinophytocola oryzae]|uniref:Uncharacterized protein n=1 Tax=Actinophytocola oryzae TaxID=502181 RepID=A0A4R7UW25_9PSEU|nr:hypothetical protein [Actinophytocola oryzae]TDV37795.1 hypothetical protein CLV71_12859 [Actinophytocola oryzae]
MTMMGTGSWNVLSGTDTDRVVLAVDFPAAGRPAGSFADLASLLDVQCSVWECVPPSVGVPTSFGIEAGMRGDDYVDRWLGDVRASGREVLAVMGYCSGCGFSALLAEHIAQWQEMPKQVLFDPDAPSTSYVYWQFHRVIGEFSVVLSPKEIIAAQQAGKKLADEIVDLAELSYALFTIFIEVGATGFDRAGIGGAHRADLTSHFASYLAYIVASSQLDPLRAWKVATAISSTAPGAGGKIAQEEFRFDIDHLDLLRDTDVARRVSEVLG